MKKLILAMPLAALLAGCVIHNPISGGPDLVITSNLADDADSFHAFVAPLKAKVASDEAAAKQFLMDHCPAVTDAQVKVATVTATDVSAALNGEVTVTAAQKQINNVSTGLSAVQNVCQIGTATSFVTVAKNADQLFQTVRSWFK